MASQNLALTETPKDVFIELSLDTSLTYTVQNAGERRAYFWEADSQPDIATIAAPLFLEPGASGEISNPASGSLWYWSDEPTYLAVIGIA